MEQVQEGARPNRMNVPLSDPVVVHDVPQSSIRTSHVPKLSPSGLKTTLRL